MESAHENGSSSIDFRTGVTSNLGEGEKFNPREELLESSSSPSTSQNHFHFVPNTTTHHNGATSSPTSEFHNTSEKGDGSKISSHLEAYHATNNPFSESHNFQLENNNSAFSSQNPFLLPSENLQQENGVSIGNSFFSTHDDDDSFSGEMLSMHSSPLGNNNNPFEVQTRSNNTVNGASFSHDFDVVADDDENHDHRHESSLSHHNLEQEDWRIIPNNPLGDESHVSSSNQLLDPLFTLEEEESTQNQKQPNPTDKNHESVNFSTNIEPNHSMASSNLGTDAFTIHDETRVPNLGKNLGSSESSFSPASKSSTLDPIHNYTNAPSKLEENNSNLDLDSSDDADIPISSIQNHGSETQNPPIQVMERTGDNTATTTTTTTSTSSSKYRIPSHVFARNKSKTEWSTASNESLFSIQMGNMSFSREMPWYYKSGELDNNNKTTNSELHMSGPLASNNQYLLPSQSQPQPQQKQTQVNKFNDMSQRSAEQHEGWGVTEEKAAETMREVIMEESLRKGGLSNEAPPLYIRHCDSSDHSNHSNGSTKSFAFKISTDGDRTLSSKYVEELRKQQKQTEQQTVMKETPNAAQTTKSTINNNAPQNRWLSCFTCCNN